MYVRFDAASRLQASKTNSTYNPPYCDHRVFDPNKLYCAPRIALEYARGGCDPRIYRRRMLVVNNGPNVTCSSTQPLEISGPCDENRKEFVEAFREIMHGAILIRDNSGMDCKGPDEFEVIGPRLLVGYLTTVARNYSISF